MIDPIVEFLDIVDENDNVVGKASRPDIYKNLYPHRIVHILIFNKKGEMALQLRRKDASYCPLHWVTAVGGHVQAGETYKQAALREMAEEISIKTKIHLAYKDTYKDAQQGLTKILTTFTAHHEGPFEILTEGELIQFFSINQIWTMINRGEKFLPELLFLLTKHYPSA